MGRIYSTAEEYKNKANFSLQNIEKSDHMPDLGVNERIILKWMKTYLTQFRVHKCNLLNLAMITESHGKWIDFLCCDDWLYFVVLIPIFLKLHFYERIN